ncbi:hypothetical protein [Streptomyces erythrochromogenes]|uniref:hypothetical protein n=1 Tax=Streptomyces erythrochromogenes TaxID=285574 RepID=UPI00382FD810
MHIVPPDPGCAGALFGLHLCTWALIAFPAAAAAAAFALFVVPFAEPPVAGFLLQGFHWQMPGDPTGYRFSGGLGL